VVGNTLVVASLPQRQAAHLITINSQSMLLFDGTLAIFEDFAGPPTLEHVNGHVIALASAVP
jgi:hypothetical protein